MEDLDIDENGGSMFLPHKHLNIELEQGWNELYKNITKLKNLLEGKPREKEFNPREHMMLYTMVVNMCIKPNDHSQELYDRYKGVFEEYFNFSTLHEEFMLKEFIKKCQNYKLMVQWLPIWFDYLDRYFVPKHELPTLKEVAFMPFHKMKDKVKDVVIALVEREREGKQIDRNVVDIFVQIGMDAYETDLEVFLLQDTTIYYRIKVSSWIEEDSFPVYMIRLQNV
jgi:cullin 1